MGKAKGLSGWALRVVCLVSIIGFLSLAATINRAEADDYDPKKAGNPIRIAAYLVHPVGVLIDYGLMRPCFLLVKREPFSTIFGYVPSQNEDLSGLDQPHR